MSDCSYSVSHLSGNIIIGLLVASQLFIWSSLKQHILPALSSLQVQQCISILLDEKERRESTGIPLQMLPVATL